MNTLYDALKNALRLIWTLDPQVIEYASRSLYIALMATIIASLIGVPLGVIIAEARFPGRRLVIIIFNTLLGVPTVVVALLVYSFISNKGPLGALDLLYTINGIVIGDVLLILPLVTSLTIAAVRRTDREARLQAMALGAGRMQTFLIVFHESRLGVVTGIIAGFGRVVGEIGVAMILGGNIAGFTRTLTTAAAMHVSQGNFELALALGIVLLMLSSFVNVVFQISRGVFRSR